MATLNNPNSGDRILPWAREATREINSQKINAGNGISITKTNAGTTISIKDGTIPLPDSTPPAKAVLSSDETSGFATTYSMEKNKQNAFSLYEFDITDNQIEIEGTEDTIDFVLRCRPKEGEEGGESGEGEEDPFLVNKSPTLRYSKVSDLVGSVLSTTLSTEIKTIAGASVSCDSELTPLSRSLDRNSENGLEIYHFENPVEGEDIITDGSDTAGKYMVIRDNVDEIPTVRYMALSSLSATPLPVVDSRGPVGLYQHTKSIDYNSEDQLMLYKFGDWNTTRTIESSTSAKTQLLVRYKTTSENTWLSYLPLDELLKIQNTVPVDSAGTDTKSIQYNSSNELEIYNFNGDGKVSKSDWLDATTDIMLRRYDTANHPQVRYVRWSTLSSIINDMIPTPSSEHWGTATTTNNLNKSAAIDAYESEAVNWTPQGKTNRERLYFTRTWLSANTGTTKPGGDALRYLQERMEMIVDEKGNVVSLTKGSTGSSSTLLKFPSVADLNIPPDNKTPRNIRIFDPSRDFRFYFNSIEIAGYTVPTGFLMYLPTTIMKFDKWGCLTGTENGQDIVFQQSI